MAVGFGWLAILRLGAVQASIGAIVMIATSLLNRIMVVEYALAAAIPAGLVAWHYVIQLSRPLWGHGSDRGGLRTPWILVGMAVLALGALIAVNAVILMPTHHGAGLALAIFAFALIGAGVGAAGTSMLAMLAAGVARERRAAAAAVTWIMMVSGIAISAGIAGALLDPFSEQRLAIVASGVCLVALLVSFIATRGLERPSRPEPEIEARPDADFAQALRQTLRDPEARRFTWFIFASMLAYSMQDLILEPFAGLVFGMTPGQSTQLSGLQHGGVLLGMIVAGVGGSAFAGRLPVELRTWVVAGCLGSALSLAGLAAAATYGPAWPLAANIFVLGLCNGVFAVAAIGSMMGLAGAGPGNSEGIRMGVWGAAQAIAFGLGGLTGAIGVDLARRWQGEDGQAFQLIFLIEGAAFVASALLALKATARSPKGLSQQSRNMRTT
jgi:BCD family chlorophyll transporter-like MFS transporter